MSGARGPTQGSSYGHDSIPEEVRVQADALMEIGRATASRLHEPGRSVDHAVLLYDAGLPAGNGDRRSG